MKLAVVPDSSERCTGVIFVLGRFTPGLSALMAGSFQVVISPLKIFAVVIRAELQVVDAREVVDDRERRDVVRDLDQLAAASFGSAAVALGSSVVSNGESLPAKAVLPPAMNWSRPPPEPIASYEIVAPEFWSSNLAVQAS